MQTVQKSSYRAFAGRQIVQKLQNQIISPRTQVLIDKLLLGKFSLAEIAKVTGISEQWLQSYVGAEYEFVPRQMLFNS